VVAEDAIEVVVAMIDALEVEVVDAMTNQKVIDVLATEEIEDLAILEVIDVLQAQETEAIEDLVILEVIEALVREAKDAMMILKETDAQNLVVLDLIDQDVLADEIKLQYRSNSIYK
jgi:hypothetical protein